ncbi:MAG: hypothetical protein RSC51_01230 [Oscillospiraceae bacterium]
MFETSKGGLFFDRNTLRGTASVRTGKTEIHFSFLARKEKPISIRKRKEAKVKDKMPLRSMEHKLTLDGQKSDV